MSPKTSADCIRKVANWTVVKNHHKFDKPDFDPVQTKKEIPTMSPKMNALFETIAELDKKDMKQHKKMFKHFVFSELRSQANGAKMIASCFLSHGWTMVYDKKHKMHEEPELLKNKGRNVALLTGAPVYDKPIGVGTKKSVLSLYNKRPENSYGNLCRVIILSGDFKEGIDLFDVKYVHIIEPQTSKADLRQAVGRATRLCGQSGLEFHPTQGWPLQVFVYDVALPPSLNGELGMPSQTTLFDLYMKNSGIDLRKIAFSNELETATIHASIDYELNKNIHQFEIGRDDPDVGWLFEGGGSLNEDWSCKTLQCNDIPIGTPLMLAVFFSVNSVDKLSPTLHKSVRDLLCIEIKNSAIFCDSLKKAYEDPIGYLTKNKWPLLKAMSENRHSILEPQEQVIFLRMCRTILTKYEIESTTNNVATSPMFSRSKDSVKIEKMFKEIAVQTSPLQRSSLKKPFNYKGLKIDIPSSPLIEWGEEEEQNFQKGINGMLPKNPLFKDIRNHVREYFIQYAWPKVVMENMCIPKKQNSPLKKEQDNNKIVNFTPTQNFLRNFFTPSCPLKGILAWHSVGTGKTCLAIATASSSFERQGYTILWVTRTSLKSDIWKNMFDSVCNVVLQEKIKNGFKMPVDQNDRMRLLSESWNVRPMSYKQFSNLVEGKNKFYQDLVAKNGREDPLKKTLLIIDEAHKLYGGADLSAQERPNMKKFKAALLNSYKKSGDDSVRLFMMTGTPITNNPMELCQLLNLIKPAEHQLAEEFETFSQKYLDVNTGKFTVKGKWAFLNDIAGSVSYLSRERDARQFSLPVITPLIVPMSVQGNDTDLERKMMDATNYLEKVKEEEKLFKEKCKGLRGEIRKKCVDDQHDRREAVRIHANIEAAKDMIKQLKQAVKKTSSSGVSQEDVLRTKCFDNKKK